MPKLFTENDKVLHMLCGAVIGGWSLYLLHQWPLVAALPVLLAAVGKEGYDSYRGGKFDWRDVLATMMGGGAALIPLILTF